MTDVRVGLVGAGFIARAHARAYADIADADVVAVAAPTSAATFVDEHVPAAVAYPDVDALLAETAVDVVDVCTPTPTHRSVIERCADVDGIVVCEKPLARTLADAEAVAPLVDYVGHVVRFDPAYRTARETVGSASVGVVRTRRIGPPPDWADWYADRDASGGVLLDLAIHDFDFLRWMLGPVERVFARRQRMDETEHAVAVLRFASGAVGHVEASWAQPESRAFTTALEIAARDQLIEYDGEEPRGFRMYGPEGVRRTAPVDRDAMQRQLEHVVAVARGEPEPAVTPAAAITTMRIALAAEASVERGRPVAPAEVSP